MSEYRGGFFPIIMSLFVALMLTIVPLPEHAAIYRPQFAMLVLIYWVLLLPHRVGVGTAWCVGLLMDVLLGGVLGEYALAFSIVAYLTYRVHTRMRMFPVVQQTFFAMGMVAIAQVLVAWINYLAGARYHFSLHLVTVLTSAICWPLVYFVLNSVQSKFAVE